MSEQKIYTPLKAIRKHCLQCSGGSYEEVRQCAVGERCYLFPYRFGKRPKQAGDGEPVEAGDADE